MQQGFIYSIVCNVYCEFVHIYLQSLSVGKLNCAYLLCFE